MQDRLANGSPDIDPSRPSRSIFTRLVGMGLLAIFLFGGVVTPRSTAATSRWQMAESYMARRLWVPGEVWANEKVYNRKGGLEEERTIVVGLTALPDERIQRHLIAAVEDGEEIAAAIRSEVDGPITLGELMGENPFMPAEGQQVTHWPTGEQRQIDGHPCSAFGYRLARGDLHLEGVAWLAAESGLPLEVTATVTSVPFKEDGVTVTAYTETNRFSLSGGGDCLLMETRSRMEISAWGFKGRVDAQQRFSRHWLWEEGRHG